MSKTWLQDDEFLFDLNKPVEIYVASIYSVVTTVTTVGYGDINAMCLAE